VVPWGWGIHGGTSVLGSVLAVVVAMGSGFTWVLILATVLYLVALLTVARISPGGA
jgi:hypothetical protein